MIWESTKMSHKEFYKELKEWVRLHDREYVTDVYITTNPSFKVVSDLKSMFPLMKRLFISDSYEFKVSSKTAAFVKDNKITVILKGNHAGRPIKHDYEVREMIIKTRKYKSVKWISQNYGIPERTVHDILKKARDQK